MLFRSWHDTPTGRSVCGSQIRDTAECNSALLSPPRTPSLCVPGREAPLDASGVRGGAKSKTARLLAETGGATAAGGPEPGSLGHELDLAALLGTLAGVLIEHLLAEAQALGRGLDVFVDVDVLEGALEAELERGVELDALAVAL